MTFLFGGRQFSVTVCTISPKKRHHCTAVAPDYQKSLPADKNPVYSLTIMFLKNSLLLTMLWIELKKWMSSVNVI